MNNPGIMICKIIYYNMLDVVENGMSERNLAVAKNNSAVTV